MRINIPFKLLAPLVYILYFSSVLLYLLLWPLRLAFSALICVISWFLSIDGKRDVLLIHNGPYDGDLRMSRILALTKDRAFLLDYKERGHWRTFSIAVQVFNCFGPQPMPQFFMPAFLPAVIVLKKFHWPKKFTFGQRSKNIEEKLERLKFEVCEP